MQRKPTTSTTARGWSMSSHEERAGELRHDCRRLQRRQPARQERGQVVWQQGEEHLEKQPVSDHPRTRLSVFDAVEVLGEFSKAIRLGLIALDGLHELDGVDQGRVNSLADFVRRAHAETADYLASFIGAASLQGYKEKRWQ